VIVSRVEEFIRYFDIEVDFTPPISPSDARSLSGQLRKIETTERGGTFIDIINVRFGRRVSQFYQLGKSLFTYSIFAERTEAELQAIIAEMKANIYILAEKLSINETLIDKIILNPGRIIDITGVEEVIFEDQGAQPRPPADVTLTNFVVNRGGVIQVGTDNSVNQGRKPGTKVGELCAELGVTRQTLYRHVDPNGLLRPDGEKLFDRMRTRSVTVPSR
jgi:hypothetical protein